MVGKVVQFRVLYKISPPNSKPIELGRVILPATGQTLPEISVTEGWLKLRDNAGRNEDGEEATSLLEKLRLAEAKAKENAKGLWATGGGKIDTVQDLSDAKNLVDEWKGKPINGNALHLSYRRTDADCQTAIVEKVLSGDRVIVRMILGPVKHQQSVLLIAGIRAPQTKRTNPSDGKEQQPQPGGDKAQQFVEERILQRNVQIYLLGTSPQNQPVGTVKHPKGSIAEFLLRAGLAWCNDFHSTMLGNDMQALRHAEEYAKANKLELFKEHVASKGKAMGDVEAVVAKIQSADSLYLRNKSGGEKRVNLSSIRQPK